VLTEAAFAVLLVTYHKAELKNVNNTLHCSDLPRRFLVPNVLAAYLFSAFYVHGWIGI
jgi:hypothetical protein